MQMAAACHCFQHLDQKMLKSALISCKTSLLSRFLAVLSDSEPWHLTDIFECLMAFLLCALVQCMVSHWQVPYDISPENTGGVSNVRP